MCAPQESYNGKHPSPPRRQLTAKASLKKRRQAIKVRDPLHLLALVIPPPPSNGKFLCPLCTSTFGRRCELKRHIAEVHTINGAKRYSCKHQGCGKSFTRKDALAKHEIVKHQGKRRFVCSTCSERFTSRYDLSRHNIRVHSNVKKRFTCEFCSAGFSQKSQLTMHKGRVHVPTKCNNENADSENQSPVRSTSSMDSLAAVAVAMAKREEANAARQADEKKAAIMAADTLLEAAAVLQPHTTSPSACPSSTPTVVTGTTDVQSSSPETHDYGEAKTVYKYSEKVRSWRISPCTIVEDSA